MEEKANYQSKLDPWYSMYIHNSLYYTFNDEHRHYNNQKQQERKIPTIKFTENTNNQIHEKYQQSNSDKSVHQTQWNVFPISDIVRRTASPYFPEAKN